MEEDTKNNTSSTTENPVEPDEVVAAETEDAVADNDNNDTSSADGGDSDNDEASNTDMEETQETAGAADSDSDIESIVAGEEDDEDARGVDTQEDTSPTKSIDGAPSDDKKRSIDEVNKEVPTHDKDGPLPTLPLKRARTAYFIFADAKRPEVKLQCPGQGVAAVAKGIGALWSALEPSEKEIYETQAAKERERVAKDTQRLKDAGILPLKKDKDNSGQEHDIEGAVIFPVARIRKICKLDPDVKGMSKESAMLITKATELFCAKLGKEIVTIAQLQNRRKLMPEDTVNVCEMKEKFMFLKKDIVDLRNEQVEANKKENSKKVSSKDLGESSGYGGKSMMSYFGKANN